MSEARARSAQWHALYHGMGNVPYVGRYSETQSASAPLLPFTTLFSDWQGSLFD